MARHGPTNGTKVRPVPSQLPLEALARSVSFVVGDVYPTVSKGYRGVNL